jgi:hypothetical protein
LGSICAEGSVRNGKNGEEGKGEETNDDGEERILELLIRLLRHDVDTGEPAAVTGVRVIPTDDVFGTTDLFARKRKREKVKRRQFA